MKQPLKFYIYSLVLVFSFGFYSCKKKEVGNETSFSEIKNIDEQWQGDVSAAIEENKENLKILFDRIAEQSFVKLKSEPSRLEVPDSVNFEKKSLDEIESLLKKVADNSKKKEQKLIGIDFAYNYSNQFIQQRKALLIQDNFSQKENFKKATDSIISKNSPFHTNIIGGRKDYDDLISSVQNSIQTSQNNFVSLPKEIHKQNSDTEDRKMEVDNPETSQSPFSINLLGWILVAFLFLSILYNILQARKISRLKEEKTKNERVAKAENINIFQPKASTAIKLTPEKVKTIFENSFSNMLSSLNSEYSSACAAMANIDAYKNPMQEELTTKSFGSEAEALGFIELRINRAKLNIIEKIDDCRDRNTAQGIIDNEIESQQFRNSKLEEEEIRNIVSRHKANLKNSLGETIDAKELDRKIDTVKETIKQDISKTIQQNSEYYISFFDTDGTIADSKKSKIRKRDSVVKFVVDPDDPIRATYTLLYDDAVMMRSGIQSYQGLLLPICKIDGHVDPNGNTIVQVGGDGTLVLFNGYWNVDNKLTVKII